MTIDILIAEDDRAIQSLIRSIVECVGYNVMGVACNGQKAVDMYRAAHKKPDVILMDYRMPLMNGIDAMTNILNMNGNARIIFISADVSIKDETLRLGATTFLKKVFNVKDLVDAIKFVLTYKRDIEI